MKSGNFTHAFSMALKRCSLIALPVFLSWGCTPEPASLGRITLDLWQPLLEGTLLDDATRTDLVVDLDGEVVELAFSDGVRPQLDDKEIKTLSANEVVLDLRSVQPTGNAARTRVGPFALEGEDVFASGIFSRERTAARLTDLPTQDDGVMSCTNDDGELYFVGGASGWAVSDGVRILDVEQQSLRTLSGGLVSRRKNGDCFFYNDVLHVVGGCSASGAAADDVEVRLNGGFRTLATIDGAGCGTRAQVVLGNRIVFVLGEEVVLVDEEFAEIRRWTLPSPRYGSSVSTTANSGVIRIVAGTATLDGADVQEGSIEINVTSSAAPLFHAEQSFALAEGIRNLDADGAIGDLELPSGNVAALVELSSDDRLLALSEDGMELLLSTGAGFGTPRRIVLPTPRPGGRLHVCRNHVVLISGGGQVGVDVLIVDGDYN
ncbi:MAG: hypothetical protein GY822_27265 [Deltaproteobacteria bacterium]|nr:hypothetical protein [Deltaproteobacteria bacterium]